MKNSIETQWDKLSDPRLCGLLAKTPTNLSMKMHNAGFKELNLNFTYSSFPTQNLETAFKAMRDLGFRGYSITIPFKEKSLNFVDEVSPEAKDISAINTAINYGSKIIGYNTDYLGILSAFTEHGLSSLEGKTVLHLGAGGAANAAFFCYKKLNAKRVIISNRTKQKAEDSAKKFSFETFDFDKLPSLNGTKIDLIVNSTPIGSNLEPNSQKLLNDISSLIFPDSFVFDMITKETDLLKFAKTKNAKTIPGLSMLAYQAVEQFLLFTEKNIEIEILKKALEN